MVILISPVSVVISHFSSAIIFGTSTLPVSVSTKNTLSVSKFPLTFPVSVFTKISLASQSLNFISPVLLLIENFSVAITFSKEILPVLPLDNRFLQLVSTIFVFPVETLILISSEQFTYIFSMNITCTSLYFYILIYRCVIYYISCIL